MSKSPYLILKRPMITERALAGGEMNKYTFEVAADANKKEIKEAIEKAFGVNVTAVNTVTTPGKMVFRPRAGGIGYKRDVKKAIVTLAQGQKLELN